MAGAGPAHPTPGPPHALPYCAVEPPPEAEQQRILARLHPQLAPLLPHAMETLSLVRAAYGQQHHQQQLSEAVAAALAAAGISGGHGGGAFGFSVGRHFSIRDVLKWCRRMASVRQPSLPDPSPPVPACLGALGCLPTTADTLVRQRSCCAHSQPSPRVPLLAAARVAAAALPQARSLQPAPGLRRGCAGGGARGGVCGGRRLLWGPAGACRGERPCLPAC